MLIYLLQITVCWSLLYLLYAIALSKETFFRLNRFYLLFGLFGGLMIPFLPRPDLTGGATEGGVVYLQTVVIGGMEVVEDTALSIQFAEAVGLADILFWLWAAGVLLFGMRFLYGLQQIYRLCGASETVDYQGVNLVLTPHAHTPFSFLNRLFIPREFDLRDPDNQKIITHERTHLTQRHTLDVLLVELLSIVFWCVPPVHFFKQSLKQIHEYLADGEVLKKTHKKQYGLLLLRQSHQGRMRLFLANYFNQSQLKNRIMMMSKKPSEKRSAWKYLAVLPLLLLLVLAFAERSNTAEFSLLNFSEDSKKVEKIDQKSPVTALEIGDPIKNPDEMPRFPGCEDKPKAEREMCSQTEMLTFIYTHITYPAAAREKKLQGTAVVNFVIGADGVIRNAKMVRDVENAFGDAVLETVAQMPKWIPGKKDGKNVAVEFNLPVKFKLEDNTTEEKKPEQIINVPEKNSLKLKNFSISPNPSDGNFRLQFESDRENLTLLIADMKNQETLLTRRLENFSGSFDERISLQSDSKMLVVIITDKEKEQTFAKMVTLTE